VPTRSLTPRSRVQLSLSALPSNNLGQVVYTHVPLFTKQLVPVQERRPAMHCGWEGNHRSGVALAMHHKLSGLGLSTYGLNGHRKGDWHPAYALQ